MAEHEIDIIDLYLTSKLDDKSLQAFEQRLKQEPLLVQEVKDRRAMHAFLVNLEKTKAFKARLESLGPKHFTELEPPAPTSIPTVSSGKKWLGLILALLVGLAIAFFIYQKWKAPTGLPRYEQVAKYEPLDLVQKDSEPAQFNVDELSQYYNRGNYQKALPLIEAYLKDNPNDVEVQIARGVCLLEQDQLASAREAFQRIALGASIYRHSGTWYLALSYLKVGDVEKMQTQLRLIPETSEMYYEQAQRMLESLK